MQMSAAMAGFSLSVVIGNFNAPDACRNPSEANPELIVHPDTVLPNPVTLQSFQSIRRTGPQAGQIICSLKHI